MRPCKYENCSLPAFEGQKCENHATGRTGITKHGSSSLDRLERQLNQLDRLVLGQSPLSISYKTGYVFPVETWVYLVERPGQQKIGITTKPTIRIDKTHATNGWRLLDHLGPIEDVFAKQIESFVLQSLDARGIVRGRSAWRESFDGYTEAWPSSQFRVKSLKSLIESLY